MRGLRRYAHPLPGLLLITFAAAPGRADDAASAEVRARALAEARFRFAAYVFDGDRSPASDGQIEEVQATGKSLMPEGLEKQLSKQDLADLIAYLLAAMKGG
jgi:hypothetical protein